MFSLFVVWGRTKPRVACVIWSVTTYLTNSTGVERGEVILPARPTLHRHQLLVQDSPVPVEKIVMTEIQSFLLSTLDVYRYMARSHRTFWRTSPGPVFSLVRSKLRLCSANHRTGYFSNLACDWLSIVWAYSEEETKNGAMYRRWWYEIIDNLRHLLRKYYHLLFSTVSTDVSAHFIPSGLWIPVAEILTHFLPSGLWIPLKEIRRSDDRLIFRMGFPILVKQKLCIESGALGSLSI